MTYDLKGWKKTNAESPPEGVWIMVGWWNLRRTLFNQAIGYSIKTTVGLEFRGRNVPEWCEYWRPLFDAPEDA